jgi:hypothetical protein
MTHTTLPAPADLTAWLAEADRTAQLLADKVYIDRHWWTAELVERNFPDVICGDWVGREDLFRLGAAAVNSPDDAIALLWNTIAFCVGRKTTDTKKRITAVSVDRQRLGALLQTAAIRGREDPAAAYEMLRPSQGGNKIDRFGPAGFTWYLYFAGAGEVTHPSQPIEAPIARALKRAGWDDLHATIWTPQEYADYCALVGRWRVESGADRNDVIVRGLVSTAPPTGWDHPWQNFERDSWPRDGWVPGPLNSAELRRIFHWLGMFATLYPMSPVAQDFSRLGRKISTSLHGDVGAPPYPRGDDEGPARYRDQCYPDDY